MTAASPVFDPVTLLRALFARAVEVADPMRALAAHLPEKPAGRVVVIGAGKASARMAEAVEAAWGPCEGLVITRYGYARECAGIEIVEAAHPVPDAAGAEATARMLDLLADLGAGDFVLALISGGASSLLVAPVEGVTLAEKQAVNAALLASGAPIGQMNVLRKHLSRVKGGQLAAAAYPARMLALMISDVPGDDPAFIGSGPTVGDASSSAEALEVARRWGIELPESVTRALAEQSSVVAPGDPRLSRCENRVIAAPAQSLQAAAELAQGEGCEVQLLGDALEGEARELAAEHARQAMALKARRRAGDPPLVLLSGGEVTVTRRGDGSGGPNAEYCLALALALDGAAGIYGLACDTDGVDGAAEVAGAVIGPETLARAQALGLDAEAALACNDAHGFFGALGDQVVTGPTLTNVNDFRAIMITA
ncbi:glycerate kinase type-2 family protein [Pararhodobacter oceanensis]|uniref:Glycerate kinase n=1 Tax=Pararhodobacter oceanensis TaxID=2172121 RepID=A0A2T8HV64_9RHOB|nr:glycerate kinase [Pararhodobacter oceanensis]PVH29323.1 glycerate kinase [Pararhodobacter oceanensis]